MPIDELAAICMLDAGNSGIIFKADHVLGDLRAPARDEPARRRTGRRSRSSAIFLASRKRGPRRAVTLNAVLAA